MRELVSSSRAIIQLFPFPPYPSPSFPTSSILFPLCLLVLYVFLLSSSAFFLLPNISSPSLHTFPRSYSHPFLFYFSLSLPLLFPYSFHILSFHSHPKFSPSLFPTFHQPLFPLLPLFSLPPFSSLLPSPILLPSPFPLLPCPPFPFPSSFLPPPPFHSKLERRKRRVTNSRKRRRARRAERKAKGRDFIWESEGRPRLCHSREGARPYGVEEFGRKGGRERP